MGFGDYFSIPIFFIIFRETTEAAIIVSVLLSFLSQVLTDESPMRKRLARQYATNLWAASEGIWVGSFSLLASVMITIMGIAMLRTNQMQEKWKVKLAKAMDDENARGLGNQSQKYALFLLPLITVLREGLETVVFIGGVTFSEKTQAIPIAVIAGVALGLLIGFAIYSGGNKMQLHPFFVGSTCLLLLLAAGLVSKGIVAFEADRWNRVTGAASDDAGTYDPRINVWALKCCDPKQPDAGFWQLFNALFGWSNVASYFSVSGYILYWVIVIVSLVRLKLKRQRTVEKPLLGLSIGRTTSDLGYYDEDQDSELYHPVLASSSRFISDLTLGEEVTISNHGSSTGHPGGLGHMTRRHEAHCSSPTSGSGIGTGSVLDSSPTERLALHSLPQRPPTPLKRPTIGGQDVLGQGKKQD
ncbi:hypothetical protein BGZ93_000071 [Podila epicladia]|nr:hypothetical protein BGZ93_000071 [Podila epicladia]